MSAPPGDIIVKRSSFTNTDIQCTSCWLIVSNAKDYVLYLENIARGMDDDMETFILFRLIADSQTCSLQCVEIFD